MGRIYLTVLWGLSLLAISIRAEDREGIVKGVESIAAPGLPGTVCVFGEKAFVIVDAPGRRQMRDPVIAAGRFGKGRVVIFGHDGYFNPAALKEADTGKLMVNLIRWAAGGDEKARIGAIDLAQLADYLKSKDVKIETMGRKDWGRQASQFAAIFVPLGVLNDDAEIVALRKYVEEGGAAFVAATGWGWAQTHPGRTLAGDMPANRLLAPMGLAFGDGTIEKERRGGLAVSKEIPAMLHAKAALDLLATNAKTDPQLLRDKTADFAQAADTLMNACRAVPAEGEIMKRIRALASERGDLPLPTPAKPLRQSDGLARVLLVLQLRDLEQMPIERIKAHPAARDFPGAVAGDAPRVTKTIAVDLRVPRWHSMGLYAAPGEIVTVTVPQAGVGKNLRLRIGAHTDHTYHLASWHRAPEISREIALDHAVTRAGNAFGGLIYVEVPGGGGDSIDVTIANGVASPLFVLGKTTAEQWKGIRNDPAPWAELASDKLILTLRSDAIRKLDDPEAVMRHWDKVMDASATLAAWPLERKSPERIVPDADISAGYMHSGYPIMTGLDVIGAMVDLEKLKSVKSAWGFYHEIGHNHQNPDWTFGGTTEVTVNLFTMHTLETVCGVSKEDATRRALVEPAARIKKYLAKPDFEAWKNDPFLALAMYAQIRNEFGWEPFKKVFAEYRALSGNERPRNDADKRDQWMVRMSKTVGKNLGPFFTAWGIPTSDASRKSIEGMESWIPAGMK